MIQDGTEINPAYSFQNDVNMGVFRVGAGQWGVAVNGEEKFRIADQVISMRGGTTQIRHVDGSAAVPSVSFLNATDQGMFRLSSTILGFSVAGIQRLSLQASIMLVESNTIQAQAGSAGSPAYSFQLNSNLGMYRSSTNRMAFATAGVSRMDIGTTRTQIFENVEMPDVPSTDPGVVGRLYTKSSVAIIASDRILVISS
jgi:hypothetical protein